MKDGFLEGKFNGICTLNEENLENYKSEVVLLIKDILNNKNKFKN